jgi:hypothetical protein
MALSRARIAEMVWREVLVAHRHARVPMPEDGHHRSLRDAGHRERAGRVVVKIVEAEILEAETLDEPRETSAQH